MVRCRGRNHTAVHDREGSAKRSRWKRHGSVVASHGWSKTRWWSFCQIWFFAVRDDIVNDEDSPAQWRDTTQGCCEDDRTVGEVIHGKGRWF
ncbi:hypothetical protein SESBI_31130 [Sesbania bispinosa]|nr:hypothetical protein SESBI_31130 [Sesbania bispinosa]